MTSLKDLFASDPAPGVATSRQRKQLLVAATVSGVLGAALFVSSPNIDIAISEALFLAPYQFIYTDSALVAVLRVLFKGVFIASLAASLVGIFFAMRSNRGLLGLGIRKWNFLFVCLVAGPGIVANMIFKEHWGRARPRDIEQFGGSEIFTPALMFSEACETNCSFVGGEAASIFMVFFALALLTHRYNYLLLGAGILMGAVIGIIRVGQGGHFLSDIIFAGIFMAILAGLIHWVLFEKHSSRTRRRN